MVGQFTRFCPEGVENFGIGLIQLLNYLAKEGMLKFVREERKFYGIKDGYFLRIVQALPLNVGILVGLILLLPVVHGKIQWDSVDEDVISSENSATGQKEIYSKGVEDLFGGRRQEEVLGVF